MCYSYVLAIGKVVKWHLKALILNTLHVKHHSHLLAVCEKIESTYPYIIILCEVAI